jgi:hypothetical protein
MKSETQNALARAVCFYRYGPAQVNLVGDSIWDLIVKSRTLARLSVPFSGLDTRVPSRRHTPTPIGYRSHLVAHRVGYSPLLVTRSIFPLECEGHVLLHIAVDLVKE